MTGCKNCERPRNMAGLCTVCEPKETEEALSTLTFAAISLCNAHRWSYGGPDTLRALAEAVAAA